MVKRYIREATKRVKHQALPKLLFSEWLFLLESISRMVNEVPMKMDQKYLYVCPQDMLLGGSDGHFNDLQETDNHLHGINEIIHKLREWRSLMQEICLQQIQGELDQMKKAEVKTTRGPVFTPRIGDIILFIPDKKYNSHKFGKVTEIDKHNLTFLTRQGESITKPIRLVTPILQNIALPNPEMKSNDSVDINSRKVNKKKNWT